MDSELTTLTSLLYRFDPELFCKRTGDGVVRVYHNKLVWQSYDLDGETYLFPRSRPYHVFSLTDTWGFNGRPVKYGSLPLWDKLKSIEDRDRQFREVLEAEEKSAELKTQRQTSRAQDMAYEFRDAVKQDTGDILTHSLDTKFDKRNLHKRG